MQVAARHVNRRQPTISTEILGADCVLGVLFSKQCASISTMTTRLKDIASILEMRDGATLASAVSDLLIPPRCCVRSLAERATSQ